MKLSSFIGARIVGNKAIVIQGLWKDVAIKFFGATFPVGCSPTGAQDYNALNNVVLYPEEGKEGIVALVTMKQPDAMAKRGDTSYIPAFLKVTWKEKDGQKFPFVDIDDPWVSTEHVGQVTTNTIEVMLRTGRRFCSTDALYYKNNKETLPPLVPDGNLLCRYLWGTADAIDLVQAAVDHKREPLDRKRIEQLTNQVCVLQAENRRVMDRAADMYDEVQRLSALCEKTTTTEPPAAGLAEVGS